MLCLKTRCKMKMMMLEFHVLLFSFVWPFVCVVNKTTSCDLVALSCKLLMFAKLLVWFLPFGSSEVSCMSQLCWTWALSQMLLVNQ